MGLGAGATPEGPLPFVEGILAATQEPGFPSRCFLGHLIFHASWHAGS